MSGLFDISEAYRILTKYQYLQTMSTDHETETNHQFERMPGSDRRVRFADSVGMELVTIILFEPLPNHYSPWGLYNLHY